MKRWDLYFIQVFLARSFCFQKPHYLKLEKETGTSFLIFSPKLSTNLLIKSEWWRNGKGTGETQEHSLLMYLYNHNQSVYLREICISYMESNPLY